MKAGFTGPLRHPGRWITIVALALTVVALRAPAADAQKPAPDAPVAAGIPGSLVLGAGTTTLGDGFPPHFVGDRIAVRLTARTAMDGSIRGRFAIIHRKPNGELFADLRGDISCLKIEGEHAVVTGVITSADTPGLPGGEVREGITAGVVVRDSGDAGDRMAWSFGETEQTCIDLPAVTAVPVERGNFVVRD